MILMKINGSTVNYMNSNIISISLVLYKNELSEITSFLESLKKNKLNFFLYVIDNSPSDILRPLFIQSNYEYIFLNKNIGYGKAHNIGIQKSIKEEFKYHLVVNPDILFFEDSLQIIYNYMEQNLDVVQIMPKILYTNNEIQNLCKLLPKPFDLFRRRFLKNIKVFKSNYELPEFNYDLIQEVPSLSGCFMFFRNEKLSIIKGFDSRFFMYMEDIDITRRISKFGKTIYFPETYVFHKYKKQSYGLNRLLLAHIVSSIKYFNKWGWFFDKERDKINSKISY